MRSVKLIRMAAFCALLSLLIFGFGAGELQGQPKGRAARSSAAREDLYVQMELFADAIGMIQSDYVDEVEAKKLVYGALKGMLASLDDYSQFMEPDEYKEIKEETKGEFGGIGVEIGLREGILTVIAPISGSPAQVARIMAGDRIVRINGKITKRMTLDEAVKQLRGEAGTVVKLSVWRERQEKVLELSITRDIIKIESVKSAKILEDRIGYINLVEFQENTPRHLEEALAKLKKEGMDSLILDLRNNPGGLLDIAVSVAEKFLEKDSPIVSTKSRIKGQNVDFKSKNASAHTGFPVVVLINEGSASASEIVAGAIQDNRRGIVVGMKSYGKGSVQTVLPMRDSSALRLTTASYYTPSGRPIRKEGIIPDVAVEQKEYPGMSRNKKFEIFENLEAKPEGVTETEKPLAGKKEEPKDFQLERAIDIIKGIKAYKKVKA